MNLIDKFSIEKIIKRDSRRKNKKLNSHQSMLCLTEAEQKDQKLQEKVNYFYSPYYKNGDGIEIMKFEEIQSDDMNYSNCDKSSTKASNWSKLSNRILNRGDNEFKNMLSVIQTKGQNISGNSSNRSQSANRLEIDPNICIELFKRTLANKLTSHCASISVCNSSKDNRRIHLPKRRQSCEDQTDIKPFVQFKNIINSNSINSTARRLCYGGSSLEVHCKRNDKRIQFSSMKLSSFVNHRKFSVCIENSVKINVNDTQRRISTRNSHFHKAIPIKFRKLSAIRNRIKNRIDVVNAKERLKLIKDNKLKFEQKSYNKPKLILIKSRPQTLI